MFSCQISDYYFMGIFQKKKYKFPKLQTYMYVSYTYPQKIFLK